MPRRLVSLIRHAPGAPRGAEPSLEAHAYAVTQDVDLVVVLLEDAVRLAVADGETPPRRIGDAPFPPAAAAHDLRALLESGIRVVAHQPAMARQGIGPEDLLAGIDVVGDDDVASAIADAEGVLTW